MKKNDKKMSMKNETAIVTGSTSGIGKKISEFLLREGCKVTICSRNEENVNITVSEFKKQFGDSVIGFPCDVTDPDALKNMVQKTVEEFGSVRILVANAGRNIRYGPFEYIPPELVFSDAQAVIGTNLIGIINSVSAVLPQMIKQKYGRIVTVSGGGASRALTNMTIYSASKGGVVSFSKCLAQELKERGDDIKLNIFNPGMLKTNLGTNIEIVPGWKDEDLAKEESELAFEYLGGDIEKSCSKVIPFVLPSCTKNGASFSGFSIMNMIRGGIKLKKILKERENNK